MKSQVFKLKIKKNPNKYIHIRNLTVLSKNKVLLDNITTKIRMNEVTAIIGKSGSGKSTLLRAINRMNDFLENYDFKGDIIIDGKNINNYKTNVVELRRKVGMVFQKPNPFELSIFNNITYSIKLLGIRDKKTQFKIVRSSLKKAAIYNEVKDRLNVDALSLSGGQQQRLCIARALALNPRIILFDEPTSALDPIATAKIESLILKLKQNYTIILVTHSLKQAIRVSKFILFLDKGKVIENRLTKNFISNPKNKIAKKYINNSI